MLAAEARAQAAELRFAGGRIDALVLCGAEVLRTSQPKGTVYGLAQVRRELESPSLRALHIVFAPDPRRPLLLGLVRLESKSAEALRVDYTETWDVAGGSWRGAEGACERRRDARVWALAEAGVAIRARPPDPPPRIGLALDLRLALPPRARRELFFAYVACAEEQSPAALASAWRGDVGSELRRTVRRWLERLGSERPLAAYRERIATFPE